MCACFRECIFAHETNVPLLNRRSPEVIDSVVGHGQRAKPNSEARTIQACSHLFGLEQEGVAVVLLGL